MKPGTDAPNRETRRSATMTATAGSPYAPALRTLDRGVPGLHAADARRDDAPSRPIGRALRINGNGTGVLATVRRESPCCSRWTSSPSGPSSNSCRTSPFGLWRPRRRHFSSCAAGWPTVLQLVAHVRPGDDDGQKRTAAVQVFKEIARPCVEQGKPGAIDVGAPARSRSYIRHSVRALQDFRLRVRALRIAPFSSKTGFVFSVNSVALPPTRPVPYSRGSLPSVVK